MLITQIDSLDPSDRSYERKFNDLQRRLDDLYDRDAGLSDALEETQVKMTAAEKRMDGERRLLEELDRIPELLEGADEQTRFDLIHEAVSEVHILPDKNPRKERVVANVTFKCPVRFFWEEIPGVADGYTPMTPDSLGEKDFRDDEAHVETVVLLSKLKVNHHIEIELKMDELDLTSAESKATYDEIKTYVLEKYGLKVSQLYIAQVKRKCGIIERKNYNVSKKENAKVPQCPPEKEAAIMDALKHFQMI